MWLPHREYRLAPERSEETIAFLRRNLHRAGVVGLALALIVMRLAIVANFKSPPRISSVVYWILLGYLVYLGVWLVNMYLRFRKPPG